jgi:hypothetical protein
MSIFSIVSRFQPDSGSVSSEKRAKPPCRQPQRQLPGWVRQSPEAMRCHNLLSPIAWERFPERNLRRNWGQETVPYASFAAACLLKLDYGFTCMTQLHRFLARHPEVVWLLGFPRRGASHNPRRCDAASSLPTARHFTRLLRTIPNAKLQFLLDDTVQTLRRELAPVSDDFGQTISLDTKHILAWVKENNPKAYCREGRFDKHNLPKGDPDCRLGCKRRHNQRSSAQEATPTRYPSPAGSRTIGEFYWGYASGVVAAKVAGWGEFVLAEYTQPFDRPDVSYFFPLMADVERRLGFRPRFGALDAAFDAFYVYEYFHQAGGFAAVPFSKRGGHLKTFDENGLPHCAAGLPMPLKYTFICRTGLFEHERGRYHCPLLYPQSTGQPCPIKHKRWEKGGCTTTLATSIGARIRYQLNRQSEEYRRVYKQRTATERINAQAKAIGIERPRLRNAQGIANQNTLIYALINLRAIHRIRQRRADQ